MGRMSRAKGAAGEREFSKLLSEAMGVEIKRKLGAARDGGDDLEYGLFSFEVKRQEVIKIEEWMAQALASAEPSGRIPVVVFRRSNSRWRACIDIEVLFQMIKAVHGQGQQQPRKRRR